ncbi:GNAT family N-acetyltransferase [Hydromonas duriensis]|uniref:Acetyltransferase (GNAT) family protein n=1 Tax=Hydromonas duriensis TaxID=1527608 RepID=A0A4R6Y807_9BURK|nr:GNAT family N-acetyltransferase [Hydromonas duriensis]TDR31499.1 acetyltransferase (GNAT) family protein [Hydromonas duriensis]
MNAVSVKWAKLSDVECVVPLFDGYRQFYQKPSDLALSARILTVRLQNNQSRVALAFDEQGEACGFAQLYPMFSSLAMSLEATQVWLLNDLFVKPSARGLGVGKTLLDFVQNWAADEKLGYLMLETAKTNVVAQKFYEAQGWRRDNDFYTYYYVL